MDSKNLTHNEEDVLAEYEVPTITTYTDEAILEELGPAQANEYSLDEGVV